MECCGMALPGPGNGHLTAMISHEGNAYATIESGCIFEEVPAFLACGGW